MIYKLYTGGHPIRAFLEFLASLFIPVAMLGGIIDLFELDTTYIGKDKTLSLVFGVIGFFICAFIYQYIVYVMIPKIIQKHKDHK